VKGHRYSDIQFITRFKCRLVPTFRELIVYSRGMSDAWQELHSQGAEGVELRSQQDVCGFRFV
jgi:hypothetical protein